MKLFRLFNVYISAMGHKKMRITEKDFLLANRRAARLEEIEAHGREITFRSVKHKSRKVYDRKRLKRAVIKMSDDGSFFVSKGIFSCLWQKILPFSNLYSA